MVEFRFHVTQELYIRRMALLVHEAVCYASRITIEHNRKIGKATSIFELLQLGINIGDDIIVRAEGADASVALTNMYAKLHSFNVSS